MNKIHKMNTSVVLIINQPLVFHFLVNLFPKIYLSSDEYLLHLVVTKINKSVINLCYKNKTVFSANKRFLDLLDNSYQNNVGLKQIGRKPTRVISFNKFSWLIYFNRLIHTLTSCYKEKKMTEEHKLFFFIVSLKYSIFNVSFVFHESKCLNLFSASFFITYS